MMKSWRVENSWWLAVPLVAIAYLAYTLSFPEPPFFCCDAEQYWKLGQFFFKDGSFSLLNGTSTYRGYLLPLLFGFIQHFATILSVNPFKLFFVINALVSAAGLAVVVPLLAWRALGNRPTFLQVLLIAALFFAFWRGFLLYPLSDSWSLFLLLTAMLLAIEALYKGPWERLILLVLSGICDGAAMNLRPIYLISVPVLACAVFFSASAVSYLRRAAMIVALLVGVILPLIPQSVLNLRDLGTVNPTVHSGGLYLLQIFLGVAIQRHECAYFVDYNGLRDLEPSGLVTLKRTTDASFLLETKMSQFSTATYIKLVLRKPLDFIGIYTRHVMNGLTLIGDNLYRCNEWKYLSRDVLLSFATVMIGIVIGICGFATLRRSRYQLFVLVLLIPLLPIIPTAMEARFMMPLHLLIYVVLVFVGFRKEILPDLRRNPALILFATVAFLVVSSLHLSTLIASRFDALSEGEAGVLLRPSQAPLQ